MSVSQYNIVTDVSQRVTSEGTPPSDVAGPAGPPQHDLVTTLVDLGRQITEVLDLDTLLERIPRLIGRLISFEAFAVYLLDERQGDLRIAFAVGDPEEAVRNFRLQVGQGVVAIGFGPGAMEGPQECAGALPIEDRAELADPVGEHSASPADPGRSLPAQQEACAVGGLGFR